MVITVYIAFFVPEKVAGGAKDDPEESDQEEIEVRPGQVIAIFKDILSN
jgi:hypothetical protein